MSSARPADPYPDPAWWGWGDPAQATVLPERTLEFLEQALQIPGPESSARSRPSMLDQLLAPSRIELEVAAEIASVVGAEHVLADDEIRLRHTRGKSTVDLLRIRAGDADDAPDLVVLPGSHQEVLELLRVCSQGRVAVVPFGGGTSVVGGLQPSAAAFAGVIALDMRRMNQLVALDEESRLAELEPGLRGPEAETLLADRGYTLGHFPQSYEYATLGGFAATRSSGQASAGYGRFDELVVSLRVATPAGTITLGRAPKSAIGPDLRQLFLGSEGALGVITSLTVQVRPAPEQRVYEGWRFETFAQGTNALRGVIQDGPWPTVLRLADEAETAVNLARPAQLGEGGATGGCMAIVGYEGTTEEVAARRGQVGEALERAGGELHPESGQGWVLERFRAPYLRDALLEAGALVETLETATFWSSLEPLYGAVRGAIQESLTQQGTPPVVLCHISHLYPAGASLYFTVGAAQLDDPVKQWRRVKVAATDAIIEAGGTLSHHHGIGGDHRGWLVREIGELGASALRAVKQQLDPDGILNPGVLIPPP